jgi:hypothetical protein
MLVGTKLVLIFAIMSPTWAWKPLIRRAAAVFSLAGVLGAPLTTFADDVEASPAATPSSPVVVQQSIEKVPLFTKKSADTQAYSEVGRGFKLLRPFGFNEFQGEGGGYLVKFASLYDVDENVVIGSVPASAGKTSITEYGSLESIGEKLAKKRGGELISSQARETDGFIFYQYEFRNPVDTSLPRPGSRGATKIVELYELTVAKGRLWSVQATSNDLIFNKHESSLRAALASFVPRL